MLDLVVKVYEIDSINDTQIGLDYMAWKNGPGANLFAAGAFAEHGSIKRAENVATPALPRNNFTATGYNYAFRYDVPSAFFDFLAVKGKARVLNEAKLAALNTRPAELTAGDQVLYYAVVTEDPSGIRDTGKPFQANKSRVVVGTTTQKDLTPVQTGLQLKVVPVIGEQTINLNLDLKWSDYNFVDDTGFPQINTRSLKSTLRGKIGEEIIIGGLERQTVVKSTRKAPILGSIPILGYAFGGETSPAEKSQLIVVITPSAVMKYNLAKTDAEKDYKVKADEQEVIDQAGGTKKIVEPKADWGTDQLGLDKDYGYIAENQK
jgi:type II secretory pathway component GspD/PulD (secretin)